MPTKAQKLAAKSKTPVKKQKVIASKKDDKKEVTKHPAKKTAAKDAVAETTHPAKPEVSKKTGNIVFNHGMGQSTVQSRKKRDTTVFVQ